MEIAEGKIKEICLDGFTVFVPYSNWERLALRKYDLVQVGLADGRTISPEQRRKAYACLGEIGEWMGDAPECVKRIMKLEFIRDRMDGLAKAIFSLGNCDVTTAREFITYLIEFMVANDVPSREPLHLLCEDVTAYVYACLMHKKCAVCGRKADLHHVDPVGMGRDRTRIDHLGLRCLPLCREHHQQDHQLGETLFQRLYHLEPVKIDERIARAYKLGGKHKEGGF